MAEMSLCGKFSVESRSDITLAIHETSCLQCIQTRLAVQPDKTPSVKMTQIQFAAIDAEGRVIEQRQYLWTTSQLIRMVAITDQLSIDNPTAVRVTVDIALPGI
jgi:hypothetical protein